MLIVIVVFSGSRTVNSDHELKESSYTTLDVHRNDPSVYPGLERPYEIVTYKLP